MAPNNLIELDALKDWQKNVGDDVLLSKLSIPGTHNSAASHKASCMYDYKSFLSCIANHTCN